LDPSCDQFQQRISKVVIRVDDLRRKCCLQDYVNASETDSHPNYGFGTTSSAELSPVSGSDTKVYGVQASRDSSKDSPLVSSAIGKDSVHAARLANSSITNPGQTSLLKSEIHLKKTPLPEFSGHRKDWPEFKAVWRELAESNIQNSAVLAYELKRSLKGQAKDKVQNIYITRPDAYDSIWRRLCEFYDDVTASVQAALEGLAKLKPIKDDDYRGLVNFVDSVESAFCQLEELGQSEVLTMRDVDRVAELLPNNLRMLWIRQYHQLEDHFKLRPFPTFMKFLRIERSAVARLAENSKRSASGQSHFAQDSTSEKKARSFSCAVHKEGKVKHTTSECRDFLKLSLDDKYECLKKVRACFNCLGLHRRDRCTIKTSCKICSKQGHHYTLCKKTSLHPPSGVRDIDSTSSRSCQQRDAGQTDPKAVPSSSHLARDPGSMSLYAIYEVFVTNSSKTATLFCDNGSNTSYIAHRAAERLHAKKLDRYTLGVTTMGNVDKHYDSRLYELSIRTVSGKIVTILAFGMDEITGPVSKLDDESLRSLFPKYDTSLLQRRSGKVDILLGCDYFGLHPKQEVERVGDHLSIMRGELGICLQGSHPHLKENTRYSSHMVKTLHEYKIKTDSNFLLRETHVEFSRPSVSVVKEEVSTMLCKLDTVNFIEGEELATETTPRCGGCKCGKCPIVGHSFSFREEQELLMIRNNLKYDESNSCWSTAYPWIIDPHTLPNNYHVALATLRSTELTLLKDSAWADKYKAQMQDMLDRGVARKLTQAELKAWDGPVFYISHLAVQNPNSKSTPVRIVFNSSQLCNGVSLNCALAKGPDNYINNLIGLLLRWRESGVAFVGDIKKMFNSVHLEELEQHCHRFLWRDLETKRDPDLYVMTRVNMGDRPAPAISTEALYMTAERFRSDSPAAADVLRRSSYVDDLIDSVPDVATASRITEEVEDMLSKGGFKIKCWQFSGESGIRTSNSSHSDVSLLKGTPEFTRVLGVVWNPVQDQIRYQVSLNFSKKKRGARTGPDLEVEDMPHSIPKELTRRIVLEQVMSLFDPLGFLCPYTLLAKIYLRETWSRKLNWDDTLPDDLHSKWVQFFSSLFQIEHCSYPRSLQPENAVGQPWLIIMSDGSDRAYGCAAYIRWQTEDCRFWCRLILAKCRIAPVNKLSTPQMELNAAVLSKRVRKVIEAEMRFTFERVLHIVDSETVLCMINKTSTRFKVYEGVRIGEIQAATNGDMSEWAWISGKVNTADWLTRGRAPQDINEESDWWRGPAIIYRPVNEWGLKFGGSTEGPLPGEKKLASAPAVHISNAHVSSVVSYDRFSSLKKLRWVIARIISMFRCKSFKGGNSRHVTPSLLREAEDLIVKDVQVSLQNELENGPKGKFSSLNPFKNAEGMWFVGSRLTRCNPMTPDSNPQKLLAYHHPATRLFMQDAHQHGHRGRNGTLAKFREKYWTTNGSKMAWQAKNKCQLCKLRNCKLLQQSMGKLPESRLKSSPPFNYSMVDFFGPFYIRGEVQKRTSGKGYGVIFTDLVMRAVHIEPVFGYDTSSFLMALTRFTSIRGWPSVMYSDPATQFIAADNEVKQMWASVDETAVVRHSSENGLQWIFGPADSPWQQGAVESLVKSAKRAFTFSVGNQRLSATEFLTLCAEVTNLLNERPIGTLPSDDADINVLTPNSLLLGRATAKNPGGWQALSSNLSTRYQLVQQLTDQFWQRWVELCAPNLIVQRKWFECSRNLRPGDVVLVLDKNSLRGQYRLGLIKDIFPGIDGKVRKVSLTYKNFKIGEKVCQYSGVKDTVITRGVHRLALLVPIDDFS